MAKLARAAGAALLLSAAAATAQPAAPDWRALARQDVAAAYEVYAADHPGMHDPASPGFPARLRRGRAAALAAADRAADYAGYVDALGELSAALADGHAQIVVNPLPGAPEWPGFVAAWRGSGMIVHQPGEGSPVPAGARILSCDGRPIAAFVRARLRTRRFRPAEPGDWWQRAPLALLSYPGLAAGRPLRCAFRMGSEPAREIALSWTAAPAALQQMLARATDGERTPVGLTEPRPGLWLIGMADFSARSFGPLLDELRRRRADLLGARAIVLDLRHNDGGASVWSRRAAEILWGEDRVARAMRAWRGGAEVRRRASEGNIAALAGIEAMVRRSGATDTADEIAGIVVALREARTRGALFDIRPAEPPAASPPAADPPALPAPVYVIVPGRCASACLEALDVFTRFPNTRLIGAPTSADSAWLEVRPAPLPSGRATALVPVNMWVGRPRRPGQGYPPDIAVNDADWSTRTFLDRIERDLAGRHRR